MRRLEFGLVLLLLVYNLALELPLRVFFVGRELGNGLVVANAGRVRRLERLVVHHCWGCLRPLGPVRDGRVLLKDLLVGVEQIFGSHALREWLLLQHTLVVLSLDFGEHLGALVVILHVGSLAAKVDLPARLAALDGVGPDVGRANDDIAGVLLVQEVFLDFDEVGLVFVCGLHLLLDHALGTEGLLVSGLDLRRAVFQTSHAALRRLVRVAQTGVSWLREQHFVDGLALPDRVGLDVRQVADHLSRVITRLVHAGYTKIE